MQTVPLYSEKATAGDRCVALPAHYMRASARRARLTTLVNERCPIGDDEEHDVIVIIARRLSPARKIL